MSERGKWDGMLAIARFNWPFYAAAGVVLLLSLAGIRWGGLFALAAGFSILGSAYFLIGSLGVSHLVYDCSDLYGWKWLERALGNIRMENIAFLPLGF